jgi:hypothetical protein
MSLLRMCRNSPAEPVETIVSGCRCHDDDHCCSSYEHCVSCCMKPDNNVPKLMTQQFRIHGNAETGHWSTAFQFCAGKCRTHQRCTEHENSYIHDRHFCFSDAARPLVCNLLEVYHLYNV